MVLKKGNQLKCTYHAFQVRQLRRLCKDIPEDKRPAVIDKILANGLMNGCRNPEAKDLILKELEVKNV